MSTKKAMKSSLFKICSAYWLRISINEMALTLFNFFTRRLLVSMVT